MKKPPIPFLLFVILLMTTITRADDSAIGVVHPGKLKSNGLVDATVITSDKPIFSWSLSCDKENEKQAAYQIVVDGMWDSGKVDSDVATGTAYAGKPLEAYRHYSWKVRVWDSHQQASAWSEPANFFTGPDQWSAQWIGMDEPEFRTMTAAKWIWYPEGNPAQSAPVGTRYFRKTFKLPDNSKIKSATVSIIADNTCELSVNNEKVGSNTKTIHVVNYDITTQLRDGGNKIEVVAINQGPNPNPAGLFFNLHIDLGNGSVMNVPSDGDWESSIDKLTWAPAQILGTFGMSPWGMVGVGGRPLPARYLRHEIQIDKPIARATAYVCGLGFFNFSVNGEKVSDHMMDPALSDYRKACYYITFDVTSQLHAGKNALGVILGNGRFFAPRNNGNTATFGFPKLLLQLRLDFADGTSQMVCSDSSWKATDQGPIRANNEYDGESYDARMTMPGWDTPGFNDAGWATADVVDAPTGPLAPQSVEPMRITEILHPKSIEQRKDGSAVIDMGQNFYGSIRFKAQAPRDTEIRITAAYSLKNDGSLKTADNRSAKCTDIYTFAGNGIETWNPTFKGQGFRRFRISGFPGKLSADRFEGLVIHTDCEPVGNFECSNDLINRIHTAIRWDSRMFLRSAPLDPDRDERQAWMGDPAKDAESEAYNFNVASFYRKWMDDVQQSQRADGAIPSTAMYWDIGEGVEWPSVFTIIPDWFVDFYDDSTVARAHYDSMKKWVLAMRRHERPDGTLRATSYGDWCDTYTMGGKIDDFGHTPGDLVSSAYQYHNYRILQRLAKLFAHSDDEKQFTDLADKLRVDFNKKFLDSVTHTYFGDTQCAYLLPITFGIVPDDQREAIIAKLIDDIMVKHQGHLSVGLVGVQWLMQTLTDIGRPDVAWTIASQKTIPSWGYMISKGATTIWERWDFETRGPGMNSEALLIQAGNLDAWFYQTLAGIRPAAPGFKRILIKPEPLGDLTFVKTHFDSPNGRIESNWQRVNGRLEMDVTVPVNTTATIIVPGKNGGSHEVASGHYHFSCDFAS